jgi:hypothetical protein
MHIFSPVEALVALTVFTLTLAHMVIIYFNNILLEEADERPLVSACESERDHNIDEKQLKSYALKGVINLKIYFLTY